MSASLAFVTVLGCAGVLWVINTSMRSVERREERERAEFRESFRRDVMGNHKTEYRARTIKMRGRG